MSIATLLPVIEGGKPSYKQRVIATAPIAYFPLNEAVGVLSAINYGTLGTAANGTYGTGANLPTLAAAAAPGGGLAPSFDGADALDIYSAALNGGFNGQLGSVAVWWKSTAAAWTDGAFHCPYTIFVNATNYLQFIKTTVNNQLVCTYLAASTTESVTTTSFANTNWNLFVITFSKAAEQVKYYMNSGTALETDTTLGAWSGALSATRTCVGVDNLTGFTNGWKGNLAHVAIWDRVLTTEIANLYSWGL